tara:strand:- start:423 stop:941 length:519 start_codon:yes stop_codon:yes gene_type:complete
MLEDQLKKRIGAFKDFPRDGIVFRDITPILKEPKLFSKLVKKMSSSSIFNNSDCVVAIDARGFIFASCIASYLSKPLILARKPGKLPGEIIENTYELEYGKNTLGLQVDSIKPYTNFAIVDDLLATGGTVNSVATLLRENNKVITGLSVVVELSELNARSNLDFEVSSEVLY